MHDAMRYYWAWLLSGVILDATLAATFLLGALAFAPSLLQDEAGWRWRIALLGPALALVHLVLLPILVWPEAKLSARDLGVALVRTATVPLAALLGSVAGIAAGFGLFMPLLMTGALFASALTRTMSDVIGSVLMLTAFAVGVFTGGAVRQLLDLNAIGLLQAGMAVGGAGLPHLLLTCRDLARQGTVLATRPVAARRFFALLTVLGASGGLLLLLRVIHG